MFYDHERYEGLVTKVMKTSKAKCSRRKIEDILFASAVLIRLVGMDALQSLAAGHEDYRAFCRELEKSKLLSRTDYQLIVDAMLEYSGFQDSSELMGFVYALAAVPDGVDIILTQGNCRNFPHIGDDIGSVIDELAIRILQGEDRNQAASFFDCCSGQGNVLAMAVETGLAKVYCGQDISKDASQVASLRLRALGWSGEVYCGDVLKDPRFTRTSLKFDRIYGNVPFVSKRERSGINGKVLPLTAKTSIVWDFIDVILQHLDERGRAVVLVQTGSLFKNTDRQVRQQLVEHKLVEAIVTLPKGLLTYSPLRTSMIVLSHGNESIRMINAENLFTAKGRFVDMDRLDIENLYKLYGLPGQDSNRVVVDVETVSGKHFKLLPSSYLPMGDLEFANGRPLGEVCQIIRGKAVTKETLDELHDRISLYGYVNSANVDTIITLAGSTRISVSPQNKYEDYEIQETDIVLADRSTTIKVGMARLNKNEHLIAGSNVLILRPRPECLESGYLMMLFMSKTGRKLLNSIQSGARIITITPRALAALVIPVPAFEKQVLMAESFEEYLNSAIDLEARLKEVRRKMSRLYEDMDGELK